MNLRVRPAAHLEGAVSVPPSKSYTHRAVILASLAHGTSTIKNPLLSEDTLASIEACRKIGAEISVSEKEIKVKGVAGKPKAPHEAIDVRNSGTTLRIMTPVAGLCNKSIILTGDESIRKRPMQPLLEALKQLGVETHSENGNPPVTVRGPMKGGRCRIKGDISSQFISGLLIAAPLAEKDTEIEIVTQLKSKPYVDMTLDIMTKFNGRVERGNGFCVPGRQMYTSTMYEVEGDYSSAAIILAAAALLDSDVTVKSLPRESKQGDRRIIDILRAFGANVQADADSVTVKGDGDLDGIEVDLSDNPDLVPPVAVVGCLAKGRTMIKNVGHLRFKESDRLRAMSTELRKMNAEIKAGRDHLEIHGVDALKAAKLHGWSDHRVVMSLAVAALRADGETVIDTAESIPVSFPSFVETMKEIGADMDLGK